MSLSETTSVAAFEKLNERYSQALVACDRYREGLIKLRGAIALEIAECAKQGDVESCTTCREVYHPMLAVADKALLREADK